MFALALFGIGRSGRIIELDVRTQPRARGMSITVVGTLFAAIAGGILTTSAFSPRYAAVVFLPLLLLVALGTTTFLSTRVRLAIVAIAVVAGFIGSFQNITTQRTQATKVAAVIDAQAKPGDIIAMCPDQLGPATYRAVANPGQYTMVTFPRGTGPQFVDWVRYAKRREGGQPEGLRRQAGGRGGGSATGSGWCGSPATRPSASNVSSWPRHCSRSPTWVGTTGWHRTARSSTSR